MATETVRKLDIEELTAAVGGGLAGGLAAAAVMWLWNDRLLAELGAMVTGSVEWGIAVTLALGVVFALPFGAFVARSIDGFVSRVMMLSRRSDALRKLLVPLLQRSALATTTYALGQGYGLAVGVLFHLLALPFLVGAFGASVPFPYLTATGLGGLVAWVVYGAVLGLVYGLVLES